MLKRKRPGYTQCRKLAKAVTDQSVYLQPTVNPRHSAGILQGKHQGMQQNYILNRLFAEDSRD